MIYRQGFDAGYNNYGTYSNPYNNPVDLEMTDNCIRWLQGYRDGLAIYEATVTKAEYAEQDNQETEQQT